MNINKAGLMAGVCGLPIFAQANSMSLADFNGGIPLKAATAMVLWRSANRLAKFGKLVDEKLGPAQ